MLEQLDLNYDKSKLASVPNLQDFKTPVPIHELKEQPSPELMAREATTAFRSAMFRRAIYRPGVSRSSAGENAKLYRLGCRPRAR